jgi:hypothetical protein
MKKRYFFIILLLSLAGLASATETHYVDEFGLHTWKIKSGDIRITLAQRKPSQTEAFFLARKLPETMVKEIANACTLQLIVEYPSITKQPPIEINIDKWRVFMINNNTKLKTRSDWLAEWKAQLTPSQAASFNWSLFPTEQTFYPQDMNMGMIMINLAQGKTFDLMMSWQQGTLNKKHTLKNLSCPKE